MAQQLQDQLKATVMKVQSSDVMNKEYTKMYCKLLIKSGKNLKREFFEKMDAISVLDYCSKLSVPQKQKIRRTVDRDGQYKANQEIIEYLSRPDDGVFQLMETLIELDMTSLVKDFHKEMQEQTISQLLLQTLTEGEQGARNSIQNRGDNNGNAPGAGSSAGEQERFQGTGSSIQNGGDNNGNAPGAGSSAGEQERFQGTGSLIQNGGDNNGNAPGAGSSAGEQEPFQGTRRIEPEGERFKSVGVQPEADWEDE